MHAYMVHAWISFFLKPQKVFACLKKDFACLKKFLHAWKSFKHAQKIIFMPEKVIAYQYDLSFLKNGNMFYTTTESKNLDTDICLFQI